MSNLPHLISLAIVVGASQRVDQHPQNGVRITWKVVGRLAEVLEAALETLAGAMLDRLMHCYGLEAAR